ncbi:MAG: hypothetical protein QXW80_05475 [Candidatus Micrarchaeia archaeon]
MEILENYRISCLEITVYEENGEIEYIVKEPNLEEENINKLKAVIENIFSKEVLNKNFEKNKLFDRYGLKDEELYHLNKNISPYGQLYPILLDENILEATILSPEKPVYVRHKHFLKQQYIKTNINFKNERDYEILIERIKNNLIEYGDGKFYEGPLDEKFYANLVVQKPPYTSFCTIKRRIELSEKEIFRKKHLTPQQMAYLWTILEIKTTIAVTGSTREYRRNMLNELVQLIPKKARLMVVENTTTASYQQEYLIKLHITKSGEEFKRVFELIQKNDVEYAIIEAEEVSEETKIPSTRTCFIYMRQTPLTVTNKIQTIVNITNNIKSNRIELIEEFGEYRTNISFEEYDGPERIYDKSRILQHWAKINHYSREKVIEALSIKLNYILYLQNYNTA